MTKYTAYFNTHASASITADVPDDVAAEGPGAISEWILENGSFPALCAQCSGWDQPYSLDLAEWETDGTGSDGKDAGVASVTDADGNTVTGEG